MFRLVTREGLVYREKRTRLSAAVRFNATTGRYVERTTNDSFAPPGSSGNASVAICLWYCRVVGQPGHIVVARQ